MDTEGKLSPLSVLDGFSSPEEVGKFEPSEDNSEDNVALENLQTLENGVNDLVEPTNTLVSSKFWH